VQAASRCTTEHDGRKEVAMYLGDLERVTHRSVDELEDLTEVPPAGGEEPPLEPAPAADA
jgi:hypothetical protein